jgi:hypothetical protein
MGKCLLVGVLFILAGCGATGSPVATPPPEPLVVGTAAPTMATPGTADTAILAALVAAATIADGSLAQTGSLHAAYLAGTPELLSIDAGRSAELQTLNGALGLLLTSEDQTPAAWRCADGLTINAVYLAMATAGQVTDGAGQDQPYQQDAAATHAVAQAALLAAQESAHQQPVAPLSTAVRTANQTVATAYGHQAVCP